MENNLNNLYSDFDRSVNWNAYLYIVQKVLMAGLTFIFFKQLSSSDFSIWANINSIVFLILLWVDFGFRKSVPKYIAKFSKNKGSHIAFTKFLIKFQAIAVFLAAIFLALTLKGIGLFIGIQFTDQIILFALAIFLLEAPIALLRLIYHAHFWNKYFNLFYSFILLIEAAAYLIIISYYKSITLADIFIIKIISGSFVVLCAGYYLLKLYLKNEYQSNAYCFGQESKGFLKHSLIMWHNSILRSLSERNFLIPMLTFYLGPELANIFKISNDWALLFQRAIVKTIGTTDTSLFSHINLIEKNLAQDAFNKIISKIFRVCIPLFGILVLLIFNKNHFIGKNQMIFQAFLLLVILYFIESVLSPFERILEVNKKYRILFLSYLPYLFFIFLITSKHYLPSIGFWTFIFILYLVKLINIVTLAIYSKNKYKIKIDLRRSKKKIMET